MKKKLWLILALVSFFLVGCSGGSYVIKTGGISSSSDSISGDYSKFSGNYYKEVKFEEGDKVSFSYLTTTKNGNLTANLLDSSDEVIENISDNLVITIPKKDTYKIQVEAGNHKGNFMISWDVDHID
jgi:hypothetical protein